MKLIRNLMIPCILLISILSSFSVISLELGITIMLICVIIVFLTFLIHENYQRIEGKVITVHDHIMIQSNGVYYDYKFHKNFDCMSFLENGAIVEGYFEDTYFIITKLC